MSDVDHEFVDTIPTVLAPRTFYVCLKYDVVVHMCLCGCATKVVTPLGPAEWSLSRSQGTISITPSIGNGALPCRSHYWITRSTMRWLPPITERQHALAFARDERDLLIALAHEHHGWRGLTSRLGKRVRFWTARRSR